MELGYGINASFLGVTAIAVAVFFIGIVSFAAKSYKKVPQGQVLVRNGAGGTMVIFDGGFVLPILHQYEYLDITIKTITLHFEGREALKFKSGEKVEIEAMLYVRVNPENASEVAQSVGCKNTFDQDFLNQMFIPKFREGILTTVEEMNLETGKPLPREMLNRKVRETIGTQLNGFVLDDCAFNKVKLIQ